MHHQLTTTAGGSVVSDGLKAHGRDAGDAPADKHDGGFSRHRSPRRPIGRRGLWERSRDAVCRRASVSARSCDMRAMRAYHTTVPSVLRQQDARGQTRCSGTQTSQHDGATFAASCGCGREPTNDAEWPCCHEASDMLRTIAGVGGSPRTSEHQRARDSLPPLAGVGGSPRTM